jgi:hypothetical protein
MDPYTQYVVQFLFGSAFGIFILMMLIGYFCWPALLLYAVLSQSRSLRRIANALEGRPSLLASNEFFRARRPSPAQQRQSEPIVPSAFGR